jgi:hypothetical protein
MNRTKTIVYWATTVLLALGMASGGIVQLIQPEWNLEPLKHLGYPLFFFRILGTWKILAAITILLPKFPLLKEWAYAGLFFAMTGALITHLALGDPFVQMVSSTLFTLFIVTSWYLRPDNRKIISFISADRIMQ